MTSEALVKVKAFSKVKNTTGIMYRDTFI